ncbi:MAG: S8 family serine peptidase, partial [Rhizobiales bacterium]|nr:S8 family serine peptidase [Rhizobacter sp.]
FPLLTTNNSGVTAPVANAAGGSVYTGGGNDSTLGTSFSAPLVAGTVGLMLSANPALKPAQVLAALRSSARAFPTTGSGASVPTCAAPTAVEQDECYCTTSTCGAGMADAAAATLASATINAQIVPSATSVTAGETVTLDASGSWPSGGASGIATYQWAVTSGATLASLTSSTSAVASLLTQGAGSVTVTLTITDTAGRQGARSVALAVAPVPAPPQVASSDGGGALQLGWLLGLLAAVIGVRALAPRRGN